jgi:hypothetical protein
MPDGPQPARHPWRRHARDPVFTGRTPYPIPPQPPLRRSLHPVYALGRPRDIAALIDCPCGPASGS